MKHDYVKILNAVKNMVNVEVVGRVVIAKRLYDDYGISGTEYQIKSLIKGCSTTNDSSLQDRLRKDAKMILLLRRMNNDLPKETNVTPFIPAKLDSIPPIEPEPIPSEDEDIKLTINETDLEQQLRDKYNIHDKNWVPVSIWGDMRNPMVKWERKKNAINLEDGDITLRELAPAITFDVSQEGVPERVAVLSIRDAHFGLLTEHPQPYSKYDLQEATSSFITAANALMIDAVRNHVRKLIIPVGSDLLHVDGNSNATTKGTRQDTSNFWWEAFDASINALNQVINNGNANFDEVVIVIEPGNHDSSLARAVGIAMKSAWGNESKVRIMDDPATMKRISFGNTHLFMHHGNSIKPTLIQSLVYARHPDVIKPGAYVEVLCGHYHHRSNKKYREPGDYLEFGGMMLRITPALCPASNWSESQGYVSSPGAQLTIYDEVGFVSLHEWVPERFVRNHQAYS